MQILFQLQSLSAILILVTCKLLVLDGRVKMLVRDSLRPVTQKIYSRGIDLYLLMT